MFFLFFAVLFVPLKTFYFPFKGARLQVVVSPQYFNYSHCLCSRGFYGNPPDCKPCPLNCECEGSTAFSWRRGYFPIIAKSSSNKIEAPSDLTLGIVLQATPCSGGNKSNCNPDSNCTAGLFSLQTDSCRICAEGSGGRLCSKCECKNSRYHSLSLSFSLSIFLSFSLSPFLYPPFFYFISPNNYFPLIFSINSYCYYQDFKGVCVECGDRRWHAFTLCVFVVFLGLAAGLVLFLKQRLQMLMARIDFAPKGISTP